MGYLHSVFKCLHGKQLTMHAVTNTSKWLRLTAVLTLSIEIVMRAITMHEELSWIIC